MELWTANLYQSGKPALPKKSASVYASVTNASRLEAIAIEAIAIRLEAIAIRLEA